MAKTSLRRILEKLRKHFGDASPPFPVDTLGLILWENIAYLASDEKRAHGLRDLEATIGLEPAAILGASKSKLEKVTAQGILKERFAEKLKEVARIAIAEHGGELDAIFDLKDSAAKKELRKYPGIGEPGAEKILLFAGGRPFLAPESNALRVLNRLGLSPEEKSYAKTYAAAREISKSQLGEDLEALRQAHVLLRRLGKELCKNNAPRCEACPLRADCPFAANPLQGA